MAHAQKCPCDYETCKQWHVHPQAAVLGVNFTEEQAKGIANLLNGDAITLLEDALKQAPHTHDDVTRTINGLVSDALDLLKGETE